MKRATVRDLRYAFPKVEASLAEGEEIEIVKRGKVVATLVPAPRERSDKGRLTAEFMMARLKTVSYTHLDVYKRQEEWHYR